MKIFISGATGFIGSRLAIRLANEGNTIHALYRSENKAGIIKHPNILLFKGDILDPHSLNPAIAGCEQVYHTAAFAKVWHSDPSCIYRLNIEGTMNVIRAGLEAEVKKFVCTSTAGVFGPSGSDSFVDENSTKPGNYFIDYESSKAILEQILRTLSKSGTSIVIVNPARVYGPGLLSESNGVTRMIKSYSEGRWRMIPGSGKSPGNYVHVEDVVSGHILAMNKGISGENYILGGTNVSYNDLFSELVSLTGKKYRMFHIPLWFMLFLSHGMLVYARFTGNAPLITPPLVKKFACEWNVSSNKSILELGYKPMSLTSGLKNTLEWLNFIKKAGN
jgi:nucleoside-diphosphate-sugar epimerase